MKNKEFKVGDRITVEGNKGTVTDILNCEEYKVYYDGKPVHNGLMVVTPENADDMARRGYTVTPTGRTATYFTVDFSGEPSLKGTAYDGGCYGCLDEYECFGTW